MLFRQRIPADSRLEEAVHSIIAQRLPMELDSCIDALAYAARYDVLKSHLAWSPPQRSMFEFGPLAYLGCDTFTDHFKTYTERREFWIAQGKLYPEAVVRFSFNRLYKDRINAVLNYVTHFMNDVFVTKNLVARVKELYDHLDPDSWYDYEHAKPKVKLEIAARVTELARAILEIELRNEIKFSQLN